MRHRRRRLRLLDQRSRRRLLHRQTCLAAPPARQAVVHDGPLVEPCSCAYYALVRAGNVNASDTLVVLGAGPVGLAVTAAAAAMGAVTIAVEPNERRRAIALQLGAKHAEHPDDIDALLGDITHGRGADVVVEVSGVPAVMARALELAAFKGRVAYVGINVGDAAPPGSA